MDVTGLLKKLFLHLGETYISRRRLSANVVRVKVEKTVLLFMKHDGSSGGFDNVSSAGSAALRELTAMCCSRDWSRVATGYEDGIQLWDAVTGERLGDARLEHHSDVTCVAVSHHGRRAASG